MVDSRSRPASWFVWLRWIALVLYGVLLVGVSLHAEPFGSPDEAANALMARQVAQTGSARLPTQLAPEALAAFHGRSLLTIGQNIVPGSFVGFIYAAGWLGALWTGAELLLVPLLALVAVFGFYGLLRRFWSPGWAFLGASLVAINPVWFQFQTLPMFHNGAFVSLLILAGYCLRRQFERPSWRWSIVTGGAYGAAILMRPVEILWTGPLIAIVLLTMPNRWKWFSAAVATAVLLQLPWLLTDIHLYGSALATGYTPDGAVKTATTTGAFSSLVSIVTPVGGWSMHSLSSAWWYLLLMLPANSALAIAAVVIYFRRKFATWQKILKLSLVSVFVLFPLIYYGSLDLYPLLPASRVGTLASYDRYWLVLFVAMIPGVVLMLKRYAAQRLVLITVVGLLVSSQAAMIVWHPGSGLLARWERQRNAARLRQDVIAQTPITAIVISGQADKYFYGLRQTATNFPNTASGHKLLKSTLQDQPVYVLASALPMAADDENSLIAADGLFLTKIGDVYRDTLWQVTAL